MHSQNGTLPDSNSTDVHITQPTAEEQLAVWTNNFASWGGTMTKAQYFEREKFLTTAPLARDHGITHWILVHKDLPPNARPILASCESLRKDAVLGHNGKVTEVITHGIGSVFCSPEYRGRGYASVMMRQIGEKLKTWQESEQKKVGFSVLWSDIGKAFYASHGWQPFPSTHIEFPATLATTHKWLSNSAESELIQELSSTDLPGLCEDDEAMIRKALATRRDDKTHLAIIPDNNHMQWHHFREDFTCNKLFGKTPSIRGALIGEPGHRLWAIWTRSYSGSLDDPKAGRSLHILRLVIEGEGEDSGFSTSDTAEKYDKSLLVEQAKKLEAIIKLAQAQAVEWKLVHVELWNPSPLVQALIEITGLQHSSVERETSSIPSLRWYGEGSGGMDEVDWIANEKYNWC